MIRYRYAEQLTPPAPLIHVTVGGPRGAPRMEGLPALLDPGADKTVVPEAIIEELQLVPSGEAFFQGFAGRLTELPLYLAEVQIHDLAPLSVRVVSGPDEPFILLGRDVLNTYRILLDGPSLTLEIQ